MSLQTGKWWEGTHQRGGFTAGMTHGDVDRGGRHGDEGLEIGRKTMRPIYDFIEQSAGKPFFVWYAPMLPHQPHNPPERLLVKYKDKTDSPHIARYWAMCEWFDETCGELLEYLDRKGLTDNTIVALVVDNGWIQQPKAAGPGLHSKLSPYDGGIRTPIVLRWPKHIAARRDDQSLASSIDLMPTLLAACGAALPPGLPGVNLLDAQAVARRKAVFGEIHTHDAVEVGNPLSTLRYRWVVEGPWKLIQPNAPLEPEAKVQLFNVVADPHEKKNLAEQEPARVKQLQKLLDGWWKVP